MIGVPKGMRGALALVERSAVCITNLLLSDLKPSQGFG
jgi:hypothetical protein